MTILISGACGFMGREVAAQAKSSGIDVVCGVDIAPGSPRISRISPSMRTMPTPPRRMW